MTENSGGDLLGAFTGLVGKGSTTSDAYMVLKYLESREVVERLENDISFREIYGSEEIDIFSRLPANREIEKVTKYWERRISVSFNPTSGIINFEVQAFSAEDSQRVAKLLLEYVQELINTLSETARMDAVHYAEVEVKRYETRLLDILKRVQTFRENEESIDPSVSAMAQIEMLSAMEKELIELRTRIAILEQSVDENAPSLRSLHRQEKALEDEIKAKGGGLNKEGFPEGLSAQLSQYESLQVEKDFAQRAYASALASLETARIEAGRRQRFLAVYEKPALPEYPLYPRKILYPVLIIIISVVLWGVGILMAYAIRDHIS
ncbi:hypothetical protein P4C99_16890 [Pontiellaceae bacterium B1224]|nr:hypothetical protein [Pontiellaceae bacterium B1224]